LLADDRLEDVIDFQPGDYIGLSDDESGEFTSCGIVIQVLDHRDHYHRSLGEYPTLVLRMLEDSGNVSIWDFYGNEFLDLVLLQRI
jgi:hypothetical protein